MTERGRWPRVWRWVRTGVLAVVTLGLVLAVVVAFVLPGILRTQAAKGLEAATGRKLSIGSLALHPFSWSVEIRDVSISEPRSAEVFGSLASGALAVRPSSLLRGAPVITGIRLVRPSMTIVRTGPNQYNVSDLLPYLQMPVPALSLEDVALTEGSIDFVDRALPREERHAVRDMEIGFSFLTTVPERGQEVGNPRFRMVIDGAPLVVEMKVRGLPRAPELSAMVDLKDLSLPTYVSYLPAPVPVDLKSGKVAIQGAATWSITEAAGGELGWDGTVAVAGIDASERKGPLAVGLGEIRVTSRVTMGQKRGLRIEDGSVVLRDLSVPFGRADGMRVGLLEVKGTRFTDRENELDVATVLLEGGRVRVSRNRAGVFSPAPLLRHLERDFPWGKKAPGTPTAWRIGSVEGRDIDLSFDDPTRKEIPGFSVSNVRFEARNVSGPSSGVVPVRLEARIGRQGSFRASGRVRLTPLEIQGELETKGLALADGDFWLPREAAVSIAAGTLDLRLQASLATRGDQMGGSIQGSAALFSPRIVDRKGARLLAWSSLTVDGFRWEARPFRVEVGRLALSGLRADVVMDEKGRLVLPEGLQAKVSAQTEASVPALPAGPRTFRVGEIAVTDVALGFTDRSVPGEFRAEVKDLSVLVKGLSSDPAGMAALEVAALLPGGAPLRVAGQVAAFRTPRFADLAVGVDGFDLAIASPYAATYLGLLVEKGRLDLNTRARVGDGKLAAENRVGVLQLTFGKSVKSKKATGLPVRLIVDLLRDADGDVLLDLPVSARTDDPDLRGTLTKEVVKNVLFPPSSPLRTIGFEPCSSDLTDGARRRLVDLAGTLGKRPAMRLDAVGYVNRKRDEEACRARDATAAKGPASPPAASGGDRMMGLATSRASAVREFLLLQGPLDPARVTARTGDVDAPPSEEDDPLARVEFAYPEP